MATYALNPSSLDGGISDLGGVTTALASALDDLNGYVNTYVANNAGATATAYQAAQTKWNTGLTEMQTSLTGGTNALTDINDQYRMTDQQGASLF
jgi:WXG100 family type VII secretion target